MRKKLFTKQIDNAVFPGSSLVHHLTKPILILLIAVMVIAPVLTACSNTDQTADGTGNTKPTGNNLSGEPGTFEAVIPEGDRNWNGSWIWAEETVDNSWVAFRKTITLSSAPAEATIKLAAESKYWLYINGVQVVYDGQLKRGPTYKDTYFDSLNITDYLKEGDNTIAVLVWYWTSDTQRTSMSHHIPGKAGLLAQLEADGEIYATDNTWKAIRLTAYKDDSLLGIAQPTASSGNDRFLMENNVYYDAREDIGNFTAEDFNDEGWPNAVIIEADAINSIWNELIARPIPFWKDYGLKEYTNMEEYRNVTLTEDSVLVMKLPYNAQVAPYLHVEAEAGKIITMMPESTYRTEYNTHPVINGNSQYRTLIQTYVTKDGDNEMEMPTWFNGQFVYYLIPAGVKVISLGYRETGFDTELSGTFISSDTNMNRLFEMAQRSLYVNMRDGFTDCPDRERASYWGDVTNGAMIMMYTLDTDAWSLYEKSIAQLLGNSNNFASHIPTLVPNNNQDIELPTQMLAAVSGFYDYYTYTGDSELLQSVYDFALQYLKKWTVRSNGLVVHRECVNYFTDWLDWGANVDTTVFENAWYYHALSAVRNMAVTLGKTDDIAAIDERMTAISKGFESLWSESAGAYVRSVSESKPDERSNALAVYAGLVPEERYGLLMENVFTKVFEASPYTERYVLEAMCKMGYVEEAQERMLKRYADMLAFEENGEAYTTLWENFDRSAGTTNHAWAGGVAIVMSKYIAGISPEEAGYDKIRIVPNLGSLTYVSASCETTKGIVSVSAEKNGTSFTMTVTVPEGSTALIGMPILAANGNVTIDGTVVYDGGDKNTQYSFEGEESGFIYYTVTSGVHTAVFSTK